jgi:hypothetical protein
MPFIERNDSIEFPKLRRLRLSQTTALLGALAAGACSQKPEADVQRTDEALHGGQDSDHSRFTHFAAPARDLPTSVSAVIDGQLGAVLPNGRFVTPVGLRGPGRHLHGRRVLHRRQALLRGGR